MISLELTTTFQIVSRHQVITSQINKQVSSRWSNCEQGRVNVVLHDLILRDATRRRVHSIALAWRSKVLDKRDPQRATTVLVASELGCISVSFTVFRGQNGSHAPIAVSAVSALSNCTTPVPRDLPFGSYWISARSTLPMVENKSTRSSLQVDHGNYPTLVVPRY